MKTSKPIIFLNAIIFQASLCIAASEHGHAGEVPKVVFWQFVDVLILLVLGIYFLTPKVKEFFKSRRSIFVTAAEKSKNAEKEAEKGYLDIKHKLDILNSTSEESIAKAMAEAADLKKNMISDARAVAEKIKRDAEESARIEAQKEFAKIKLSTITEAILMTELVLKKDIGSQDHQKLQAEFAKNIDGVHA